MVLLSMKTHGSKLPLFPIKKALRTLFGRLSLVDKRFEISNHDIIRDIKEIIILGKDLVFL